MKLTHLNLIILTIILLILISITTEKPGRRSPGGFTHRSRLPPRHRSPYQPRRTQNSQARAAQEMARKRALLQQYRQLVIKHRAIQASQSRSSASRPPTRQRAPSQSPSSTRPRGSAAPPRNSQSNTQGSPTIPPPPSNSPSKPVKSPTSSNVPNKPSSITQAPPTMRPIGSGGNSLTTLPSIPQQRVVPSQNDRPGLSVRPSPQSHPHNQHNSLGSSQPLPPVLESGISNIPPTRTQSFSQPGLTRTGSRITPGQVNPRAPLGNNPKREPSTQSLGPHPGPQSSTPVVGGRNPSGRMGETYVVPSPSRSGSDRTLVGRSNVNDRIPNSPNFFTARDRSTSSQSLHSRTSSNSRNSVPSNPPSQAESKPPRMYPSLKQQIGVGIASSGASSGMFLLGSETIHELRKLAGNPYYEQVTPAPITSDPMLELLLNSNPGRHFSGTDFSWSNYSDTEARQALELELGLSTPAPVASNPFDGLEDVIPQSLGKPVNFTNSFMKLGTGNVTSIIRPKRQVSNQSTVLPSVSKFLANLTKNIYMEMIKGRDTENAGNFIKQIISKSRIHDTAVSRMINSNLQNRQYQKIIPMLNAAAKDIDVKLDNVSVISQMKSILDQRLKSSANILSSLIQSSISTLTKRLNLSFTDVYECMAVLGRMGSEIKNKVSNNQASWVDILILCLIPVILITLVIMIWLIKRSLDKGMDSLHRNIIGEYNKVLKELESQAVKRDVKVRDKSKNSKTRAEEDAITPV